MASALAWSVFACGSVCLFFTDCTLARYLERRGHMWFLTLFHCYIALVAHLAILWAAGVEACSLFFTGYLFEVTLSIDNIGFFFLVLSAFSVPPELTHFVLTGGILGAVFLRLVCLTIGLALAPHLGMMSMVVGAMMVAAGLGSLIITDDFWGNPANLSVVKWVGRMVPLYPEYSKRAFWVRKCPAEVEAVQNQAERLRYQSLSEEQDYTVGEWVIDEPLRVWPCRDPSVEFDFKSDGSLSTTGVENVVTTQCKQRYLTMLILPLVALELVDALFALDATAVKVAMIGDLYLSISSTVLGLFMTRSLYSLMDPLIRHFHYLRYGLGLIMIVVGLKVAFQLHLTIPAWAFPLPLIGVLLGTVLLSVIVKPTHA